MVLKGILHPVDAGPAARTGIDGVIASNHGGEENLGPHCRAGRAPERWRPPMNCSPVFTKGAATSLDGFVGDCLEPLGQARIQARPPVVQAAFHWPHASYPGSMAANFPASGILAGVGRGSLGCPATGWRTKLLNAGRLLQHQNSRDGGQRFRQAPGRVAPGYSGFKPDAFTTLPHFA